MLHEANVCVSVRGLGMLTSYDCSEARNCSHSCIVRSEGGHDLETAAARSANSKFEPPRV
jgi:hypothetical protein